MSNFVFNPQLKPGLTDYEKKAALSMVPELCPSIMLLPNAIRELNKNGRYDWFVTAAECGLFHDYKFTYYVGADYAEPKTMLFKICSDYAGLITLRKGIVDGLYDDKMDEADKEAMRQDLARDGASDGFLRSMLGL